MTRRVFLNTLDRLCEVGQLLDGQKDAWMMEVWGDQSKVAMHHKKKQQQRNHTGTNTGNHTGNHTGTNTGNRVHQRLKEARWGVTGIDHTTGMTAKQTRNVAIMERTRTGTHQAARERRNGTFGVFFCLFLNYYLCCVSGTPL